MNLDDVIFYLIVVTDTAFGITQILIVFLFLLAIIFTCVSHIKKQIQLKLLSIAYMVLYDVISFILPLFFVWWLAALFSIILIIVIRHFYEKQSILLHLKQTGKTENYDKHLSRLHIVVPSTFISYMCGLLVFIRITQIG